MKQHIHALIDAAIAHLKQNGALPDDAQPQYQLDRTKDPKHGDFATNVAMMLAKAAKKSPRDLAQMIIDSLGQSDHIEKVDIAGPGFINFTLTDAAFWQVIPAVLTAGEHYGRSQYGKNTKVHLEFVSANPTGPLHVGHGRGAAYGGSLGNLLSTAGFAVHREYYVNDAGRQMDILATSVWLRYLEAHDVAFSFPINGYKGEYIRDIAAQLQKDAGDSFVRPSDAVFANVPADEPAGGDKEAHIDGLIANAKALLGEAGYMQVHSLGLNLILDDIRDDLSAFGVMFDEWFSERSLTSSGDVQTAIDKLTEAGYTYEKDGALWFNAIHFGDEKDRVLQRANGQTTYFASDVAYHMNKFNRGYEKVIDILGADHHGYVTRVKASIEAMGGNPEDFSAFLVQFAILYRDGERVQMSTRSGSFVTLRELREEVGDDAARFFYVMRRPEQHLDFDLDLAKSQSNENPVYYIQYAHARVCSVFGQLVDKGYSYDQSLGLAELARLTESHEKAIITELSRYPELIESAAKSHEPHQIAHFCRDLANHFHTYYNAHQFIVEDDALRNARLCLILAVKQVLANGLKILGVSAPESM